MGDRRPYPAGAHGFVAHAGRSRRGHGHGLGRSERRQRYPDGPVGNQGRISRRTCRSPYEWAFDADTYSGEFEIEVTASDVANNKTKVEFEVQVNGMPTVRITDPGDGDIVSELATVHATVEDDGEVEGVIFYVDGVEAGADEASPYRFDWDTCDYPNGTYVIDADAIDDAGQEATDSIYLTVDQALSLEISAPSGPAEPMQDLVALVTDDNGIVSVTFTVDGTDVATTNTGTAVPGEAAPGPRPRSLTTRRRPT